MRWRRRRAVGRLPSLGQDYDAGHRSYVEHVGPEGERWLRQKPFSAPPSRELAECLRTFAHIVERLGLGFRAQVLDVGCGPGWLSEYLARCGYWVTGVDVSEDMVRIARERVDRIGEIVGEGVDPLAEFHAMPVREMPWSDRFDVAVLYDTMHHFDDELETLRVILRTLVPGGRIFIHEGVRPPPGSEAERNLIEEMKRFGTLESPFDPEYLADVLEQAGFEAIVRFAEVDELFDVEQAAAALDLVAARLASPHTNTVIAAKPVTVGLDGDSAFRAGIVATGEWRDAGERELALTVVVVNEGRSFWPAGGHFPFPQGTVTVGPYLASDGDRLELPRVSLPHSVSPGQQVAVEIRVPREAVRDADEVTIDLVREGLAWFGELGSPTLVVPLPGR